MEDLRQTLLAPACGTFLLLVGCIIAMKDMVKCRYAAKDDKGKIVLQHPYRPWEPPVDPKHRELAEIAFRSYKMNENVKEWAFLSLPLLWIVAIFGGCLPYVTNDIVDGFVILSSTTYAYANYQYIKGYVAAPENRIQGFYLRFNIWKIWLFLSGISLSWSILQQFVFSF